MAERYDAAAELNNAGKYQIVSERDMQTLAAEANVSMANADSLLTRQADGIARALQDDSDWLFGSGQRLAADRGGSPKADR
jgi:hypothetical protein